MRWGVLGPGKIASAFVDALRRNTRQCPFAVASRSRERAQTFADTWAMEHAYDSYEALVRHPDVDIVYIATPHSEHLEHGLLALRAGKHVLIEKPMTTCAQDARILVQEARARTVPDGGHVEPLSSTHLGSAQAAGRWSVGRSPARVRRPESIGASRSIASATQRSTGWRCVTRPGRLHRAVFLNGVGRAQRNHGRGRAHRNRCRCLFDRGAVAWRARAIHPDQFHRGP
ncbi:oxidoreductase [Xanthomonas citri pv. citri str. 306]|uniref:Oxidoreductase n=1 Tax=Xanthomonas axonopodis pv. citri (strain 306) TaxID=190486 RepID=A0AAI8EST1_XANAC|nr:oxidoreductase [Xanthomonas citri pv. citri str. 306]